MKKRIWYILLITCVACACVRCKTAQNEPTTETTTNTGSEDDDVDNQDWTSGILIRWDGTSVTVTGEADSVSVSENQGYVTVISEAREVVYKLTGQGTGQFSIYSDHKFKLELEDLTLTCSDGPAINNQGKKTCYVVLTGENSLTDAGQYATSSEDRKAAFFSEGQLSFSGSGILTITGNYKHALASDDYIRFTEGFGGINLTSKVSDGMHANDGIIINDGTINITANAEGIQCDSSSVVITGGTITITSKEKGIKSEGDILISGGTTTVVATGSSMPEGIESKGMINITGGTIYAQSNDDAINAAGELTISGGIVMAYSTNNDGIDANGNCTIKGGTVYAIGARSPELGIDANTEGGYKLYVQGGNLVAIGGLERNASLTQSCYSASSLSKNVWYALYSNDEPVFVFKTPSSLSASTCVVSTGGTTTLKSAVTTSGGTAILNDYALTGSSVSGGTNVSLSAYSGQGGGPGGGGGGRPGGGGGW